MTPLRRPEPRVAWASLTVAVIAATTACGGHRHPGVAAAVEGRTIADSKAQTLVAQFMKSSALEPEVKDGDLNERIVRKFVIEYLLRMTYLDVAAERVGVSVPDDAGEAQNISALDPDVFAARGWSAGDFQRALRAARLSRALAERLFPTVPIPESDLRQYYDQNAAKLAHYWHASSRVAIFDQREPAEALRQRVGQGAPFEETARALGAVASGNLGEVTPDAKLGGPLLQAIGTLQPGQPSEAITIQGHWFVVLVDRRIATPATTFDDIKPELTGILQDVRRQALFDSWLTKQLQRANVKVASRYGRWDPATGTVE